MLLPGCIIAWTYSALEIIGMVGFPLTRDPDRESRRVTACEPPAKTNGAAPDYRSRRSLRRTSLQRA
jgi:hypothetical protein